MTIDEMINRMLSESRTIDFVPGKYGRVDLFTLKESRWPEKTIATLDAQPGQETISCLIKLDELVRATPTLVCVIGILGPGAHWLLMNDSPEEIIESYKFDACADLYRDRMAQQQKLFDGKLKRGRKAFGFMPLDGGR